ncbi:MarR family transcriptional regulator [Candidatus Saccharibacteria bacterium]|nr:MarR family transcriptional regulator [Candidatus Saccharibacteria bacterium]
MKNNNSTQPLNRKALLEQLIESFQQSHRSITRIKSNPSTGLPHGQKALLLIVATNPHSSIKQLAKILDVTPAAITQQVETLVGQGLLIRQARLEDRRNVSVSLSPPGQTLVKKLKQARLEKIDKYFNQISDQQLEVFVEVLNKVNQAIKQELDQ